MAQTARSEGMGIEGGDGEVGHGWLEKGGNRRHNALCSRLSAPLDFFQLYGSSLKTGPFRGRFGKKVRRDRVIYLRPFCRDGGVFFGRGERKRFHLLRHRTRSHSSRVTRFQRAQLPSPMKPSVLLALLAAGML